MRSVKITHRNRKNELYDTDLSRYTDREIIPIVDVIPQWTEPVENR